METAALSSKNPFIEFLYDFFLFIYTPNQICMGMNRILSKSKIYCLDYLFIVLILIHRIEHNDHAEDSISNKCASKIKNLYLSKREETDFNQENLYSSD